MPKDAQANPYAIVFFQVMRDGPAYGYELAARFRKMAGGHIRVSYGTIYPFLRRMERGGFIRSRKDEKSGRVYYELTHRGIEAHGRLSKRTAEIRRDMEEKLLGALCIHAAVFGRKALKDLLKRAPMRLIPSEI
jgi:DNA-binding PadR family transcriptional regulator